MEPFSFGDKFRISVFGSSHGPHVGVEIDGCPAGVKASSGDMQLWLDRRKPGKSSLASGRKEEDRVIVEAGIKDGATTGGKIRMLVENLDADPSHYGKFGTTPRPGHADYPAIVKYGDSASGSGFFSGRMTAAFVMAGAVAKKLLEKEGIFTMAHARKIGTVEIGREPSDEEIANVAYANEVHTGDASVAPLMAAEIEKARDSGDSVGGVVECRVVGMKPGMGEPMFASIESAIASAVFAIPGAKGIEFGSGFLGASSRGSENNDEFMVRGGKIVTRTNNCGGVLGGLTTGMPIVFRVAFKPTSSIFKPQKSVNVKTMKEEELRITGRHDPCIAVRAVSVVENVAAICIADIVLKGKEG